MDLFKKLTGRIRSSINQRLKEFFPPYKGEIFYVMKRGDVIIEEGYYENVVVKDAGILLARLMKGPETPSPNISEPKFGVLALAVGTGYPSWNLQSPPPANINQRSLWNEIGRKAIQSADFIDGDGSISGIPTNVIDLTTIFSESEAVGPLTEMGLIGGDINPSMAVRNPVLPSNGPYSPTVNLLGKDTLVNYKTFKVVNKPNDATLSYTWRLTF